jgi:hypothetical protein
MKRLLRKPWYAICAVSRVYPWIRMLRTGHNFPVVYADSAGCVPYGPCARGCREMIEVGTLDRWCGLRHLDERGKLFAMIAAKQFFLYSRGISWRRIFSFTDAIDLWTKTSIETRRNVSVVRKKVIINSFEKAISIRKDLESNFSQKV